MAVRCPKAPKRVMGFVGEFGLWGLRWISLGGPRSIRVLYYTTIYSTMSYHKDRIAESRKLLVTMGQELIVHLVCRFWGVWLFCCGSIT